MTSRRLRKYRWVGPTAYLPDSGRIVHPGDIISLPAGSKSPHLEPHRPKAKPKEQPDANPAS